MSALLRQPSRFFLNIIYTERNCRFLIEVPNQHFNNRYQINDKLCFCECNVLLIDWKLEYYARTMPGPKVYTFQCEINNQLVDHKIYFHNVIPFRNQCCVHQCSAIITTFQHKFVFIEVYGLFQIYLALFYGSLNVFHMYFMCISVEGWNTSVILRDWLCN